jgi:hypothetical protein
MSSPYLSAWAIRAIRDLLDSAQGQTPLGRILDRPVRVLECAQTARDIELSTLTQHNDRLNRENERLCRKVERLSRENERLTRVLEMDASEIHKEHEKLWCPLGRERIDARGKFVEVRTDLNRAQSEIRLLRKKIEEQTGKKYVWRTPKPLMRWVGLGCTSVSGFSRMQSDIKSCLSLRVVSGLDQAILNKLAHIKRERARLCTLLHYSVKQYQFSCVAQL